MPRDRKKAEEKGRKAETAAALFLRLKGYVILERRFRSKRGEIDIIARKRGATAFIEVKARKTREDALFAISAKQRRRIEAAAEDWLIKTGFSEGDCRFDIITVAASGIPSHITDAWRVNE